MMTRVQAHRWTTLVLLIAGLVIAPAAIATTAFAQDAAATAADDAAPADQDPAAAADDAAAGAAAAADEADPNDPFNQGALPTVDEEAMAPVVLAPLKFLQDMFYKGGPFMYPLLFASVLGLGVIIERMWTLSRAKVNTRALIAEVVNAIKEGGLNQGIENAIEVCQRTRGPIAAIIHAGLMRANKGSEAVEKAIESAGTIEMSFLQRGLIVLASIANVAPLLGFLGTVSGMINAFEAIAEAETVSAKLVASGISEALITTASGLIVAIPVQLANNFFISRIDRFVLEMEEASVELVDTIVDLEHQA